MVWFEGGRGEGVSKASLGSIDEILSSLMHAYAAGVLFECFQVSSSEAIFGVVVEFGMAIEILESSCKSSQGSFVQMI